jgi:hypothetical protein
MMSNSESYLGAPGVLSGSVNSSPNLVGRYRALSSGSASVLAAIASFAVATVCGFLGGAASMYLYDRARSKGDDAAVGLGGLFAVGTFTFVVAFTWLRKTHHPVSSRTSLFASTYASCYRSWLA